MVKYPKISEAVKKAHAAGKMNTSFGGKTGWAKGLSKLKDIRLLKRSRLLDPIDSILKIYSSNKGMSFKLIKEYINYNKVEIYKCGHEKWMGKLLSYDLHHKNGNKKDCRKENLEFLCPNCHSLTSNYGFKGRKHLNKNEKN